MDMPVYWKVPASVAHYEATEVLVNPYMDSF